MLAQALMTYETLTEPDMQAVLNGTFEGPLVPSPRLSFGSSSTREPSEVDEACHISNESVADTLAPKVVKDCGDEDGNGDEHDVCGNDTSSQWTHFDDVKPNWAG